MNIWAFASCPVELVDHQNLKWASCLLKKNSAEPPWPTFCSSSSVGFDGGHQCPQFWISRQGLGVPLVVRKNSVKRGGVIVFEVVARSLSAAGGVGAKAGSLIPISGVSWPGNSVSCVGISSSSSRYKSSSGLRSGSKLENFANLTREMRSIPSLSSVAVIVGKTRE